MYGLVQKATGSVGGNGESRIRGDGLTLVLCGILICFGEDPLLTFMLGEAAAGKSSMESFIVVISVVI